MRLGQLLAGMLAGSCAGSFWGPAQHVLLNTSSSTPWAPSTLATWCRGPLLVFRSITEKPSSDTYQLTRPVPLPIPARSWCHATRPVDVFHASRREVISLPTLDLPERDVNALAQQPWLSGVNDHALARGGELSRLENRSSLDETQVATLGRYVAALGGQLELVARFGEKRIVLAGVSQSASDEES